MSKTKFVLIAVGLSMAVGSAARYATDDSWTAGGWPTAKGRIISSQVEEVEQTVTSGSRASNVVSYEPRILYRYTAAGSERVGSRIWSAEAESWSSREGAEAFAAEYPLSSEAIVYFDPADPDNSHLRANWPHWGWLMLVVLGLGIAWLGTKSGTPRQD